MSSASPAQLVQIQADVDAVKEQLYRALPKAGISIATNAELLAVLALPLTAALGIFSTDNVRRTVEGLEVERQTYSTWSTRWRKWAEAGQRDDGSAYPLAQWQAAGRSISNGLQFWTGEAVKGTAFAAVENAQRDTVTTITQAKDAATNTLNQAKEAVLAALPSLPTPEDLKSAKKGLVVVGGALLLVTVLGAVGYAVRSFR